MPEYLIGLLTSSTILSAMIAAVNYWYKERLAASIKHDYELKMVVLEHQHAAALEAIRADLKVQELKMQVRFAALHEERARAIKMIYERLHPLVRAFGAFMRAVERGENDNSLLAAFNTHAADFQQCFKASKIYFKSRLADNLESIVYLMTLSVVSPWAQAEDGRNLLGLPSSSELAELGKLVVSDVENEFREILGVISADEAEAVRRQNIALRDGIAVTWPQARADDPTA